jgi:hypothetical protein
MLWMPSYCPACNHEVQGAFPAQCPNCPFNVKALAGQGTSSFQKKNWNQHADILYGRNVGLYGKRFNTSFDHNGQAALDDLVRFTITYGDRVNVPTRNNQTPAIVAYIPDIIGSGTSIHNPGLVPCSGIVLMSPHSTDYAHAYPMLDQWLQTAFPNVVSHCRVCGAATTVGQPVCAACYVDLGLDWQTLLNN